MSGFRERVATVLAYIQRMKVFFNTQIEIRLEGERILLTRCYVSGEESRTSILNMVDEIECDICVEGTLLLSDKGMELIKKQVGYIGEYVKFVENKGLSFVRGAFLSNFVSAYKDDVAELVIPTLSTCGEISRNSDCYCKSDYFVYGDWAAKKLEQVASSLGVKNAIQLSEVCSLEAYACMEEYTKKIMGNTLEVDVFAQKRKTNYGIFVGKISCESPEVLNGLRTNLWWCGVAIDGMPDVEYQLCQAVRDVMCYELYVNMMVLHHCGLAKNLKTTDYVEYKLENFMLLLEKFTVTKSSSGIQNRIEYPLKDTTFDGFKQSGYVQVFGEEFFEILENYFRSNADRPNLCALLILKDKRWGEFIDFDLEVVKDVSETDLKAGLLGFDITVDEAVTGWTVEFLDELVKMIQPTEQGTHTRENWIRIEHPRLMSDVLVALAKKVNAGYNVISDEMKCETEDYIGDSDTIFVLDKAVSIGKENEQDVFWSKCCKTYPAMGEKSQSLVRVFDKYKDLLESLWEVKYVNSLQTDVDGLDEGLRGKWKFIYNSKEEFLRFEFLVLVYSYFAGLQYNREVDDNIRRFVAAVDPKNKERHQKVTRVNGVIRKEFEFPLSQSLNFELRGLWVYLKGMGYEQLQQIDVLDCILFVMREQLHLEQTLVSKIGHLKKYIPLIDMVHTLFTDKYPVCYENFNVDRDYISLYGSCIGERRGDIREREMRLEYTYFDDYFREKELFGGRCLSRTIHWFTRLYANTLSKSVVEILKTMGFDVLDMLDKNIQQYEVLERQGKLPDISGILGGSIFSHIRLWGGYTLEAYTEYVEALLDTKRVLALMNIVQILQDELFCSNPSETVSILREWKATGNIKYQQFRGVLEQVLASGRLGRVLQAFTIEDSYGYLNKEYIVDYLLNFVLRKSCFEHKAVVGVDTWEYLAKSINKEAAHRKLFSVKLDGVTMWDSPREKYDVTFTVLESTQRVPIGFFVWNLCRVIDRFKDVSEEALEEEYEPLIFPE